MKFSSCQQPKFFPSRLSTTKSRNLVLSGLIGSECVTNFRVSFLYWTLCRLGEATPKRPHDNVSHDGDEKRNQNRVPETQVPLDLFRKGGGKAMDDTRNTTHDVPNATSTRWTTRRPYAHVTGTTNGIRKLVHADSQLLGLNTHFD